MLTFEEILGIIISILIILSWVLIQNSLINFITLLIGGVVWVLVVHLVEKLVKD